MGEGKVITLKRAAAPLRSRPFVCIWAGQTISRAGDRCFDVALLWLLVGLTGSTILIGTVLMASYIPTVILLVIGGVWADRVSPRGIILVSDLLRAVVTALFALLVTLRALTVADVFAFAVAYGLVSAFVNPALSALRPSLVPPDEYPAAASLNQMGAQMATLLGPALGGYLISLWSVPGALAFDAATFIASVVAVALMGRRPGVDRPPVASGTQGKVRRLERGELLGGVRFLRGEPGMAVTMAFFALTNGLNNAEVVLVPVLARSVLHFSSAAFGLLTTFFGLGALGGALAMATLGQRIRRRAAAICGGMLVFGLAIAAMGAVTGAVLLDAAYLVAGTAFIIGEVTSATLWQRIIPPEMRGRVFSVMGTVSMGLNPLGFLFAGWLGQVVGVRAGLWIGGGAIGLLSILAFLVPAVRGLDTRLQIAQRDASSAPQG